MKYSLVIHIIFFMVISCINAAPVENNVKIKNLEVEVVDIEKENSHQNLDTHSNKFKKIYGQNLTNLTSDEIDRSEIVTPMLTNVSTTDIYNNETISTKVVADNENATVNVTSTDEVMENVTTTREPKVSGSDNNTKNETDNVTTTHESIPGSKNDLKNTTVNATTTHESKNVTENVTITDEIISSGSNNRTVDVIITTPSSHINITEIDTDINKLVNTSISTNNILPTHFNITTMSNNNKTKEIDNSSITSNITRNNKIFNMSSWNTTEETDQSKNDNITVDAKKFVKNLNINGSTNQTSTPRNKFAPVTATTAISPVSVIHSNQSNNTFPIKTDEKLINGANKDNSSTPYFNTTDYVFPTPGLNKTKLILLNNTINGRINNTESENTTNSLPILKRSETGVNLSESIQTSENETKCTCDTKKDGIRFQFNIHDSNDNKDEKLASYMKEFLATHFPLFQISVQTKSTIKKQKIFVHDNSMVTETIENGQYEVETDSYLTKTQKEKLNMYPSLYQCTAAIRYCSLNHTYCEYHEGDYESNIIITVPHGGSIKPRNINKRQDGCYINNKCVYNNTQCIGQRRPQKCNIDTTPNIYSKQQAIVLANKIKLATGKRPHLVIMNIHHGFIDVEQLLYDQPYSDSKLESVWYDFHNFIGLAKDKIIGRGILIDLHSHQYEVVHRSDAEGAISFKESLSVELGYAILTEDLQNLNRNKSSIRCLANHVNANFNELINGKRSLKYMLNQVDVKTKTKSYLFHLNQQEALIKLYGSYYGGLIDAIKLSVPYIYGNISGSNDFAEKLSSSLIKFMKMNYY